MTEGVTRFRLAFTRTGPVHPNQIVELNVWRTILSSLRLIGRDPVRYGGAAYGNLSKRLADHRTHTNAFLITGTQTGGIKELTNEHFALVTACDPGRNLVIAQGPIEPSSESLSHWTLYELDSSVQYVFHVHSPEIWRCASMLTIPTSREDVEYGTPAMAEEIKRLFRETNARFKHILAMGGHEDGIIVFGRTSEETGAILVKYLIQASLLRQGG